jgi:hypothetical protein
MYVTNGATCTPVCASGNSARKPAHAVLGSRKAGPEIVVTRVGIFEFVLSLFEGRDAAERVAVDSLARS